MTFRTTTYPDQSQMALESDITDRLRIWEVSEGAKLSFGTRGDDVYLVPEQIEHLRNTLSSWLLIAKREPRIQLWTEAE